LVKNWFMHKLTLLFFSFVFVFSMSASNDLDELTEIYSASSTDEKFGIAHRLFFVLEIQDIDSCMYYISDLQDIGIREGREDLIALSNYFYGWFLSKKSIYNEALKKFESAAKYFDYSGNDTLFSEVTNAIGNNFFLQGELLKAETNYLKAIQIAEKANSEAFMLIPYPNLARVYMQQGKNEEAEKLLDDYIQFYSQLGRLKQQANAISVKGQLYLNIGKIPEATRLFEQSLEYSLSLGSNRQIAHGLTNMAIASFYAGKPEKALDYFRNALEIRQRDGDAFFLAEAYFNMGDYYIETEVYDSALFYYDLSLQTAKGSSNKIGIVDALKNIAEVYAAMGQVGKQVEFLQLLLTAKEDQYKEKVDQELSILRASFSATERENEFYSALRERELQARLNGMHRFQEYWIWILIVLIFGLAGVIIYQRSKKSV
jgi:tetratricopeptide (TPR) repeat protein